MAHSGKISELERAGLAKWQAAASLVRSVQAQGHTITIQDAYDSLWPKMETVGRYIRLPEQGELCPHSNLSRAKLNQLILPSDAQPVPPVKSIVLPNLAGNKRGCRLILLSSLMGYLRELEKEPEDAIAA